MPTMDLSTAINIFLRQSIRENGMPFKITRDNPSSIEARRQTETHTWPCSITRPGTRGKDAVRPPALSKHEHQEPATASRNMR